jgi:O-acetyl-ADP-ribose deacetylase (regulator of RNase III)
VIRVVVDDLASLTADAIVRPATTRLDPTAAALRRLEILGGEEFQHRIRLSRELAVGAAVVTAAGGDLPAEFVIHAVIRSEEEPVTRGNVARAWQSALHQAQEWGFGHVSVPPLGTGAGNLTLEDAAEIMATGLHAHRTRSGGGSGDATCPTDVSFVVERPEDQQVFEAAIHRRGTAA